MPPMPYVSDVGGVRDEEGAVLDTWGNLDLPFAGQLLATLLLLVALFFRDSSLLLFSGDTGAVQPKIISRAKQATKASNLFASSFARNSASTSMSSSSL